MKKLILMVFFFCVVFVTAAQANGAKSRLFDFNYLVAFQGLEDLPSDAGTLDLWLPYLADTPYQTIEQVTITPHDGAMITHEEHYGNKMIHFTFNTPIDPTLAIDIQYKIRRYEFSNKPEESIHDKKMTNNSENFSKYLKSNRLVTLSPRVRQIAKEVTKDKTTTLEKARAIYDYVFENVSYDKSIPGYGFGDTERVCNLKAGNCTDFHSLFISLSRASEIPAKFVIGIPIAQERKGQLSHYHCWAEFHDEQLGWIPVDISEAWKDKSKKEYHFGTVDESRLEFSHGRDIVLKPAQKGAPLNYFIYPYAELNGKEFKNIGVLFKYQDIEDNIAEQTALLKK